MSGDDPAIVWFRDDLRLSDNPALARAVATKRPLLCLYVLDEESPGLRRQGGAAKWMLHQALEALEEALRARKGELVLLKGAAGEALPHVARIAGAGAVFWNRRYGAAERAVDASVKTALAGMGLAAESSNGALLREPWTIASESGQPFRLHSAFWRAFLRAGPPDAPTPAPRGLRFLAPPASLRRLALADLNLSPRKPDWAGGLREAWRGGEKAAQQHLADFVAGGLASYAHGRDRPGRDATSHLSPHLRSGALSPRQLWRAVEDARASGAARAADCDKVLSELGWREFCYHLLFHFLDLATRNFQPRFDAFPWRDDSAGLRAWTRGLTGYPLVDAGMRELWTTGAMHNRVRMATASFLIKHLLIDWRRGEEWFWDTLVDADPANNAGNWQWVAGSGADAAPYFRIFNPVLQGEKFDAAGDYVRRWVPELARLPASLIHKPWKATQAQLAEAGVRLGETYPAPIVDHDAARKRALAAFAAMRGAES